MLKNKIKYLFLPMALCLCLTACQKQEQGQEQFTEALLAPEKANYDTIQAETAEYVMTSQGSVSIEFPTAIDLSWETEGASMKELLVEDGQEVKAGDVLMTFEIEADEIALEELEIQLLRKQEDYTRKKDEREKQIAEAEEEAEEIVNGHSYRIAMLNIEKQRIDYEQYVYETEKAIAELQEQIAERKTFIENNKLVAPFDGVIGSVVYYSEGDPIEVGEELISMYATDQILFRVSNAQDKLRYNMEVTLESVNVANATPYSGRVISAPNILPAAIDQGYALIALDEEITVEDNGPGRGYGFAFNMEFSANLQELQDVLMVNKDVIQKEDGKSYVYVLKDGAVHKRFVSVGLSSKTSAWILDGLFEGQEVILD